jgi:hypothetical protein
VSYLKPLNCITVIYCYLKTAQRIRCVCDRNITDK